LSTVVIILSDRLKGQVFFDKLWIKNSSMSRYKTQFGNIKIPIQIWTLYAYTCI